MDVEYFEEKYKNKLYIQYMCIYVCVCVYTIYKIIDREM